MRQLLVRVPRGGGKQVLEIAEAHGGANLMQFEANTSQNPVDAVVVHIPNEKVEDLLAQLENIPDLHITINPRGVMALRPPSSEAAEQVTQVQERSPIEVFLGGLQSVGSWRGFLSYAIVAGIIVWIGLFTNSVFLLVAAMLIAPFAGPAMNAAIATARGDRILFQRSLLRYFTALGTTIVVAGLLSFILRQESITPLMASNSQVSAVAVFLPLAAGAAGAITLVQSERSSLVSGAAIGMLVAASLSPPAGIIGMAIAIGRWEMVGNGVFLLLLQLVGINLSASLVFRLYGLTAKGARYNRGQHWFFRAILALTGAALVALLGWQFSDSPNLQRSSQTQRVTQEIQELVSQTPDVALVEANVRFSQADIEGQNTLLCIVYVQRLGEADGDSQVIRDRLTRQIQSYLLERGFNVTPLVNVTVLEPPNLRRNVN
ncbi:MAG: TIGR00341 family protein [Cyanobacteriota bacterium]|nr:TIGR00341 family protein [Cyanobacteriota bacterium]